MPWTLLFSLFGSIPGAIGSYLKGKNDLALAQVESARQIELARANLAGEIAKAELDKATVALGMTSPTFKYATFVMWFGPFVLGVIWPAKATLIFNNLSLMPLWYVQSIVTIMFTVWGISVASPVIANIFTGLTDFYQSRKEAGAPLALAKLVLRSTKQPISEAEVSIYDKVSAEIARRQG